MSHYYNNNNKMRGKKRLLWDFYHHDDQNDNKKDVLFCFFTQPLVHAAQQKFLAHLVTQMANKRICPFGITLKLSAYLEGNCRLVAAV